MMPAAEQDAPATTESGDKVLDSRGWEFGGFAGNMAHLAFDGKADTMWQHGKTPSHFRVDMKKAYTLNGFAYLPRQDGKTQGMTSRPKKLLLDELYDCCSVKFCVLE